MVSKINCGDIAENSCEYHFSLSYEEITDFLLHYNEIHDPDFVPKCKEDLIAEYNEYYEKLVELIN